MHILTGQRGYLLSHLLKLGLPLEGYCYHFGCPIDSHSRRNQHLLEQHIKDSETIVHLCRQHGLKLVYASSEAVRCSDPDTQYRQTKSIVEGMLDPARDLIWRIPRVYSWDRGKGLVAELKEGLMPRPNAMLAWVKLEDFMEDFVGSLGEVGYRAYKGVTQYTKVKDILPELKKDAVLL